MGSSYSVPKEKPTKLFDALVASLPPMQGKIVAITGCTSGTGFIAAKVVANKGAEVIMLNRPSERADKALKELREAEPNAKVTLIPCDLQDFDSVREAAKKVAAQYPQGLDVLCNNAGIMACADKACKDGFDVQMKTNHLSHFLLTKELFPLLAKRAEEKGEARVVNHSSGARKRPDKPVTEEYYGKNGGKLGGDAGSLFTGSMPRWQRYQQTKLANVVFTLALHERLQAAGSKVKALVAHPGLSATNLQASTVQEGGLGGAFTNVLMRFSQSAEDGTCGILRCMCDAEAKSGEFYGPNGITGEAVLVTPEPNCTSAEGKEILWRMSDAAIGGNFEIKA